MIPWNPSEKAMSHPTAVGNSKEIAELRLRVDQLAQEMTLLQQKLRTNGKKASEPWWEAAAGLFANDPIFEQVVAEGRKWRESQRLRV
jgi:hypothetical protein